MALGDTMEHRFGERKKLALPIGVRVQDTLLTGLTKDIGRGGMFIEMDMASIKVNCFEIHIASELTAKHGAIRIPVFVIHRSDTGAGVMFWGANRAVERSLKLLLKSVAEGAKGARQVPCAGNQPNNDRQSNNKAIRGGLFAAGE